jgi:hypothetical protein
MTMATTISYKNEGFLYIAQNKHETKPFIKGHIIDTNNKLICPGEIVPTLINPEYEELGEIKFYTPLLKGTSIRIYWYNDVWEVSTIDEIYPLVDTITNMAINEQVHSDLLDKNKVYYATITDNGTTIILKYTTEKSAPELHLPHINNDLAFTHHIPLIPFDIEPFELQHMMKTLYIDEIYGLVLFKPNGEQIELWSKYYYILKSMEKPDNVSIYTYYFNCLNTYALEEKDEFEIIMIHLLCDINEFTIIFPEHKEKCDSITKKIDEYCLSEISKLKYLLSLNIEDSISLISPMPSRKNSII